MDLRELLKQATDVSYNTVTSGLNRAGSGIGYVNQMVGSLNMFGSTKTTAAQGFDERHYFLIPDRRNPELYSLAIIRSLPEGVPPINELPKRRVLHLPHGEADAMLRNLLIKQTQASELAKPAASKTMADRAKEIADYIDALDDRVFGGFLLIGGLVAIFNPVAGAAIAAKSLIPSLGLFAAKYGMQVAGESLSHADVQRKAKQAEKEVLNQFKGSNTVTFTSPLLAIWDRALRTSDEKFDPRFELICHLQTNLAQEHRQWLQLEASAILDVFDTSLKAAAEIKKANLSEKSLQFLELLRTLDTGREKPQS